jgi:hypothetical protein
LTGHKARRLCAVPALLMSMLLVAASAASAAPMVWGVDGGSVDNGHAATYTGANILGGRGFAGLDYEYTTSPATVSASVGESLAAGISVPLVIIETPYETQLSSINPVTYATDATAIIKRVVTDHPSVKVFELINEPNERGVKFGSSKGSNAADYAVIVKDTYETVKAEGIAGVTLLAFAHGTYAKVGPGGEFVEWSNNSEAGRGWIGDMLTAQPSLKKLINGWSIHPYGSPTGEEVNADSGFLTTKQLRAKVRAEKGSGAGNWWITEVGFNLGGEPPTGVKTEAEQSEKLSADLNTAWTWHKAGWLHALYVYSDNDGGWGLWGRSALSTYTTFASAHTT